MKPETLYPAFLASQNPDNEDPPTLTTVCNRAGNLLPFYDGAFGDWYLYLSNLGAWVYPFALVREMSWSNAYEAAIDVMPTIAQEEIPEAYGLWVHQVADRWMITDETANADSSGTFISEQAAISAALDLCQYRDLAEGYTYQSNASGTGIVSLPEYEDLRPVNPETLAEHGLVLIWETED